MTSLSIIPMLCGVALLASCGSQTASSADTAVAGSTAPGLVAHAPKRAAYRFVGKPIVLLANANPDPAHNLQFTVLVRLDRALPRAVNGSRSLLQLDDTPGAPFAASSHPHCYLATISSDMPLPGSPLRKVKDGTHVVVAVRRHHVDLTTANVAVRHVDGIDDSFAAPSVRKLGCASRRSNG
ncbi:MAG TPA: hypothetical protein VGM33_16105 [Baekduia sp.]